MKENIQENSNAVVNLSDEPEVKKILVDTVLGLWQIVNNLTRLRPSKRDRYRVTIFGSARIQPDSFAFQEVKRLAGVLTTMGCDVVTGGGPGLMLAANEGAASASGAGKTGSVGIRVDLPFEQEVNPFVQEVYEHGTFFTRLHHFVLTSDAFVVTPGGIGTLLEAAMIWQLLQVRHLKDVPLIFIGKMWNDLVEWVSKNMLTATPKLISPEDISIAVCAKDADEAIALLQHHQNQWLIANET
ncbi:MAG TPA: LOG family protein [Acidobacteriota bacterium]|nr:LOG family protein [Acidobacteriota bacterium]